MIDNPLFYAFTVEDMFARQLSNGYISNEIIIAYSSHWVVKVTNFIGVKKKWYR